MDWKRGRAGLLGEAHRHRLDNRYMDAPSSDRAAAENRAPQPPAQAGRQNLLAEPRRMKILEWLQEEGSARVRDLSAAFGVSEATIRTDLERLDIEGHITREHGGAFLK